MCVSVELGPEEGLSVDCCAACRKQHTLGGEVCFSGIGVHSGQDVTVRFFPAKVGTGIVFRRVDLPGNPEVPATVEYVQDTSRSTSIGIGNVSIQTVEHLLAALYAYQIDNAVIEISGVEPPVGDGSSRVFIEMIEEVGVDEQEATTPVLALEKPVYYSNGDIHLVALPSDCFQMSYTLNYPGSKALQTQYQSFEVTAKAFAEELAPCRTFARYEEISLLMDHGLIKGGSLDNAVVIKDDVVFSKEGLRFSDEMVRHKMLDLVGDLSLVGFQFRAHVISIRSGHTSNVAFAKKLYHSLTAEKNQ